MSEPEKKEAPVEEKPPAITPEQAVAAEVMIRDESGCSCVSDTVKCCKCSCSLCLNGAEVFCGALSLCCIGMSNLALGCKKCLEEVDCDGH